MGGGAVKNLSSPSVVDTSMFRQWAMAGKLRCVVSQISRHPVRERKTRVMTKCMVTARCEAALWLWCFFNVSVGGLTACLEKSDSK